MNEPGEKKCPFCGEMIKAEAVKCRFCGEFMEGAAGRGLSRDENARQAPPGYAVGIDTDVLFEGNLSRILLVKPTLITIFWIVAAILVRRFGSILVKGHDAAKLIPYIAAGIVVVALGYWLFKWLDLKSCVFRITNDRIEYEHGIFSKTVLNTDLWRIQDITFNANLIYRIFGLGCLTVLSSDKDTPVLNIGPIHNARSIYDRLKKAQLEADRRRGVVHVEQ